MIVTLTEYDVYCALNQIIEITSILQIEESKPSIEPDAMYAWISITSDTPQNKSNYGNLMKRARVSIHVIAPLHEPDDNTSSSMIAQAIDVITNSIVGGHNQKDIDLNNKGIVSIEEGTPSPMLYKDKNRAKKVKDYFITYLATNA